MYLSYRNYNTMSTEELYAYLNEEMNRSEMPSPTAIKELEVIANILEERTKAECLTTPAPDKQQTSKLFRNRRKVAIMIAAAATILASTVITSFARADRSAATPHWNDDVFAFRTIDASQEEPEIEIGSDFLSMSEALEAYPLEGIQAPDWLPDDVVPEFGTVSVSDDWYSGFFLFQSPGGESVSIVVSSTEMQPDTFIEKTDSAVEEIEKDGIYYFYLQNNKNASVTWFQGKYEICIVGNYAKKDLLRIAMSMASTGG